MKEGGKKRKGGAVGAEGRQPEEPHMEVIL